MYAGVCPAATGDPGSVICDPGKGYFNATLNRGFLALDLPAQEGTTIIFQSQGITHIVLKETQDQAWLPGLEHILP